MPKKMPKKKTSPKEAPKTYGPVTLPTVNVRPNPIADAVRRGRADFIKGAAHLSGEPQRRMVQLFTGKKQTPSEAMGIKNRVGAFAVDAVLDPFIVGGAAKTVIKGAALARASLKSSAKFKPNPTSAYRMIGGEKGLKDAVESKMLRSSAKGSDIGRVHKSTSYVMGSPPDGRMYGGKPNKFRPFKGPYMAEVKNAVDDARFTGGAKGKTVTDEVRTHGAVFDNSGKLLRPSTHIPTSEANLYKQDWLRGYKPVDISKELSGFSKYAGEGKKKVGLLKTAQAIQAATKVKSNGQNKKTTRK